MRTSVGNKRLYCSGRSSVSMLLPESVVRYTEIYSKDLNKKSTGGGANDKRKESVSLKGDVEVMLQTVASAAAQDVASTLVSLAG